MNRPEPAGAGGDGPLFPHEKLSVYHKSLDCFGEVERLATTWSKKHAFVDHLSRAMESILFNLAEAVRIRTSAKKRLTLDYSLGSVFECAACLDIALLKGLLDRGVGAEKKGRLLEIGKMLIGLRGSWGAPRVAEQRGDYGIGQEGDGDLIVFHHERLDMYKVAFEFYHWFVSTELGKGLSSAFARSVDALATRVVLHIAEGNGRYAELSRQSFLDTANAATMRLAVCLDMGLRRGVWSAQEIARAKLPLLRVGQMTAAKGYED